jgi:hypothetical protein
MNTLYAQYVEYFELLKLDRRGEPKYDHVFVMGIDTETKQISSTSFNVLSYQVATVGQSGANNIIIYKPFNHPRSSLPEIIKAGICSTNSLPGNEFARNHAGKQILVIGVAHYAAAELSSLRDRDESYITKRLTLIQKCPITDGHPIKMVIDGCAVDFHLFDTMLLTPAKFKSLAALGALLGDTDQGKLDVSPYYKKNMDLFLRDRPDEFERYALRDSELCLKLFLLLQKTLNDVVYDKPVKLFRTISSASVSGFLQENMWFDEYRQGVANGLLA